VKNKMNKTIANVLILFIWLAFSSIVLAGERIVQLNLSGCADCNADNKIGAILKKTKGVKKHENKGHGLLVVTFEDEITTLPIIINQLKRGKLFVEGEPIFLK
jgi:hypothetical protein